jgi:hypothetical protein
MTTLKQALYNFQLRYTNALANEAKREIRDLEEDWNQINNWWDVYFQSIAEGDGGTANTAIVEIVKVLGGTIDTSVLPVLAVGALTRKGVVNVLPGLQKVSFTSLGGTNYVLDLNLYNSNGVSVGYTRGAKEEDGFYINPSMSGTLEYRAEAI